MPQTDVKAWHAILTPSCPEFGGTIGVARHAAEPVADRSTRPVRFQRLPDGMQIPPLLMAMPQSRLALLELGSQFERQR
ncbi:hypothetical protein [Arthrobacter methylotrophus]|uniref:hypothetical protein n=1 Tax=Arthrobacter methylotrophus TaxID=121291 RepID=UPI0031EA2F08